MRARSCRPALVAAGLLAAATARAQARPMPPGVGSVTLVLQRIDNTGHRLTDGFFLHEGQSVSEGLAVEVGYGIDERLTVSAGLPYIAAKYTGLTPTPANLPVDSGHQWHGSAQDLSLAARYNAVARGPLSITPSVGLVLPSHSYNYQGEAVVGRRLRELQAGVSIARTLQEVTPSLEIGGSYTYAFVQQAEVGVPNNRSNASVELDYALTSRLQAHGAILWQRTHGGLRFGDGPGGSFAFPGEVNTPGRFAEHDRLLRDDNTRVEAGLAYALGTVDVFATYLGYASGTDTHAGRAVTAGVTWYFGALPARRRAP